MELTVVHLLAEVDDALEVIDDIEEVIEIVVVFADVHDEVKHVLLALERTNSVDLIEGILLEDDEVDDLGFPERLVVIYRHTVVTEDVDLLLDLFTTLQIGLHVVDHRQPVFVNQAGDIFLKLRVFHIFGVRVDGVHSRVTFAVGTSLFQSVEATCHFLRTFGNRLFEVTTGRRNGTEESNRTCSSIIKVHVTCACIESTDDSREVHREGILSRKLLQTVGHLTECLCPTGSGVRHEEDAQTHRTIVLSDGHGRINRRLTGCHRHVGCVGDDDGTLHEFASGMRVIEFGELSEGLYDLVGTLTAGSDDHNVCFGLFGDSVLEDGLTGTERTWDKACSTFTKRVRRVDGTHTCLEQFEGTRFLAIRKNRFLHRPFLNHSYFVVLSLSVGQNRHHFVDGIFTGCGDGFHGVCTFKNERHHDLVRLVVFIHFTQPSGGFYLIAHFGDRCKRPFLLLVKREVVLTTFEEHAGEFVQVILQTVVVTAEQTRAERHLQHVSRELHVVAHFEATCGFEDLSINVGANDLDDLCHQFSLAHVDVANFVLRNRTIDCDGHQVGNNSFYFSSSHIE